MRKYFLGLLMGTVIGAGAMIWAGPSDQNVVLEQLQTTSQQEERKSYVAAINQDTFMKMLDDSKGSPCYCFDNERDFGSWCEHEELYCNATAIEECKMQKRFESHTCYTGIPFNIRPK